MLPKRLNKFYIKIKMQINNGILHPLGITNTIIRIVEMKRVDPKN